MKDILKTLIVNNSVKKWTEFIRLYPFFKERDKFFDKTIVFIENYFNKYNLFPKFDQFKKLLNSSTEDQHLLYITTLCEEDFPIYSTEEEFIAALVVAQKMYLEMDIIRTINEYNAEYSGLEVKDKDTILESVEGLITKLYQIRYKIDQSEESNSSLVYGQEAVDLIKNIYAKIEEQKKNQESIYFDIGVKGFEDVQMKRGDFIVIGGYTSHCKSVWLRYIIYQFLVKYHMNCAYFSFEMGHDPILSLFHLLHANNKEIFPNTPYISKKKFKHGELSDEEKNFFFEVAVKDFANEERYGSLRIEQPKKSKYSMLDLQMRVKYIESTEMPIHVIGIDYLPLMYPIIQGNKSPDMEDYNQMIRDFKNYILTHTTKEGESAPIIGISPTQISRKGLNECLKNDGRYTLDAIRMYHEMETSGDIVFSTLFTDSMKIANKIRTQNLKNRDESVIIDPIEVQCDFEHGYTIGELGIRTDEEIIEVLQSIDI